MAAAVPMPGKRGSAAGAGAGWGAAFGVITALESAGFTPGDDVEIAGVVFELDPGAPL